MPSTRRVTWQLGWLLIVLFAGLLPAPSLAQMPELPPVADSSATTEANHSLGLTSS